MNEKECEFTEVVPISEQEYNDIISLQQSILQMVADRQDSATILGQLCAMAESLLPNSVGSIMLQDPVSGLMNVLSAPSVPEVGHQALAGLKPGPGGGSCGNAVFHNEPQYVINTFTDERWENIRQIAYDFNLCSCWSMPIRDTSGEAIGSFALSSFEHRAPSLFHRKLLETGAAIVGIVLRTDEDRHRINILASAIEHASEGVIITDSDNQIIEVNQAFQTIYGYSESDVLHHNPSMLSSGKHDATFYESMWKTLCDTRHWSGEIVNKKADGDEITQWMSVSAIGEHDNKAENFIAIFSDLTELKKTHEHLEFVMTHDALTGLGSKGALEARLTDGSEYSLVLINVDNFSYFNMAYGFNTGDELLRHIASVLTAKFSDAEVFRIDSDEFALLYTGEKNVEMLMFDIQTEIDSAQAVIEGIGIYSTVSCGGAVGSEGLLRNTTLALKLAKDGGKNRYVVYDDDIGLKSQAERDHFVEANHLLRRAIKEDAIVPYFQGIRDNRTGKIVTHEALARIVIDDNVTAPGYFLETAQLSGLLPEITRSMINKTFAAVADYGLNVTLNITEDDLNQNYLCDYFSVKLAEYSIEAEYVTLEILERVSAKGKDSNRKQLMELKQLGFKLAIDDFGTEYSNFERLLDMDIDLLKIDGRYIKDIDSNVKSREIVTAIAGFAKNAGIACVAEFVHNDAVQQVIEELGIEFSQGYAFSEPAPML